MCSKCGILGHSENNCASQQCHRCQEYGHIASQCTKTRKNESRSCHQCGEIGHLKFDCPQNQRCQRCYKLGSYCSCKDGILVENKTNIKIDKKTLQWLKKKRSNMKEKINMSTKIMINSIMGRKQNIFCYNCGASGHLGSTCKQADYDTLRSIQLKGLTIDWNS